MRKNQIFGTLLGADQNPAYEAVVWFEGDLRKCMTYQQVAEHVKDRAAHFRSELAIHPGDRIAVIAPRGPEYLINMLALWQIGAVYMPLSDAWTDKDAIYSRLHGSDVKYVLTVASTYQKYQAELAKAKIAIRQLDQEDIKAGDWQPHATFHHDSAYIYTSSGTTGTPKLILLPHAGIMDRIEDHIDYMKIKANDGVLGFLDFGFDASMVEMLLAWCSGNTLYITTEEVRTKHLQELPVFFSQCVNKIKVAILMPSVLQNLPASSLPGLNKVVTMGEACYLPLFREKGWFDNAEMFNGYGPTETTFGATLTQIFKEDEIASIHRPMKGVTLFLREYFDEDEANQTQPKIIAKITSDKGIELLGDAIAAQIRMEILISSNGIGTYLNYDPMKLVEKFKNQQESIRLGCGDNLLFETGDLVQIKGDKLEYVGRKDNQIKRYGKLIVLEDVENVIMQTFKAQQDGEEDLLKAALALSVSGNLIVFLLPKNAEFWNNEAIKNTDSHRVMSGIYGDTNSEGIEQKLRPNALFWVDKILKTQRGKDNRKLENYLDKTSEVKLLRLVQNKQTNPLQHDTDLIRLMRVWAKVLEGKELAEVDKDNLAYDIDTDFRLIGGDSVKLTQMIQEVWNEFMHHKGRWAPNDFSRGIFYQLTLRGIQDFLSIYDFEAIQPVSSDNPKKGQCTAGLPIFSFIDINHSETPSLASILYKINLSTKTSIQDQTKLLLIILKNQCREYQIRGPYHFVCDALHSDLAYALANEMAELGEIVYLTNIGDKNEYSPKENIVYHSINNQKQLIEYLHETQLLCVDQRIEEILQLQQVEFTDQDSKADITLRQDCEQIFSQHQAGSTLWIIGAAGVGKTTQLRLAAKAQQGKLLVPLSLAGLSSTDIFAEALEQIFPRWAWAQLAKRKLTFVIDGYDAAARLDCPNLWSQAETFGFKQCQWVITCRNVYWQTYQEEIFKHRPAGHQWQSYQLIDSAMNFPEEFIKLNLPPTFGALRCYEKVVSQYGHMSTEILRYRCLVAWLQREYNYYRPNVSLDVFTQQCFATLADLDKHYCQNHRLWISLQPSHWESQQELPCVQALPQIKPALSLFALMAPDYELLIINDKHNANLIAVTNQLILYRSVKNSEWNIRFKHPITAKQCEQKIPEKWQQLISDKIRTSAVVDSLAAIKEILNAWQPLQFLSIPENFIKHALQSYANEQSYVSMQGISLRDQAQLMSAINDKELQHLAEEEQKHILPFKVIAGSQPLFIIHPLTGETPICYRKLSEALPQQTVIAIQMSSSDYECDCQRKAERYKNYIRKIQPTGDYLLMGWSFGGSMAYRIAHLLEQEGKSVAIVINIDSPPPEYLQAMNRLRQAHDMVIQLTEIYEVPFNIIDFSARVEKCVSSESIFEVAIELVSKSPRTKYHESCLIALAKAKFNFKVYHDFANWCLQQKAEFSKLKAKYYVFEAGIKRPYLNAISSFKDWANYAEQMHLVVFDKATHFEMFNPQLFAEIQVLLRKYQGKQTTPLSHRLQQNRQIRLVDSTDIYIEQKTDEKLQGDKPLYLDEFLDEYFLCDEDLHCLLLLGEPGSGKTTYTKHLEQLCLKNGNFYPIHLCLQPGQTQLLKLALMQLGMSESEYDEVYKNLKTEANWSKRSNYVKSLFGAPLLIIFDGYDEALTDDNIYEKEELQIWTAKAIISCRHYSVNLSRLNQQFGDHKNHVLTTYLQLFSPQDIELYLRQHENKYQVKLSREVLKTFVEMKMLQNPLILSLAVTFWDSILKLDTRAAFYELFFQSLYEKYLHETQALLGVRASVHLITAFKKYSQYLASMAACKAENLTFSTTEPENLDTIQVMKLKSFIVNTAGAVSHITFWEFHFAHAVIEAIVSLDIIDPKTLYSNILSLKMIAQNLSLLAMIRDIIRTYDLPYFENFVQNLLLIVYSSRHIYPDKNFDELRVRTATNAISMLNAMKIPFSGLDMNRVRVPNAYLSGAIFHKTKLAYANLKGARIDGAVFDGADLQGIDLAELTSTMNTIWRPEDKISQLQYNPATQKIAIETKNKEFYIINANENLSVQRISRFPIISKANFSMSIDGSKIFVINRDLMVYDSHTGDLIIELEFDISNNSLLLNETHLLNHYLIRACRSKPFDYLQYLEIYKVNADCSELINLGKINIDAPIVDWHIEPTQNLLVLTSSNSIRFWTLDPLQQKMSNPIQVLDNPAEFCCMTNPKRIAYMGFSPSTVWHVMRAGNNLSGLVLLNLKTKFSRVLKIDVQIKKWRFSSNDSLFAILTENNEIIIYSVPFLTLKSRVFISDIIDFVFTADASNLLIIRKSHLCRYRIDLVEEIEPDLPKVDSIAISDGKYLFSVNEECNLTVTNLNTFAKRKFKLCFNPTELFIGNSTNIIIALQRSEAAGMINHFQIWNYIDKCLEFEPEDLGITRCFAIDQGRDYFAFGYVGGFLAIYSIKDRDRIFMKQISNHMIIHLDFHHSAQKICACDEIGDVYEINMSANFKHTCVSNCGDGVKKLKYLKNKPGFYMVSGEENNKLSILNDKYQTVISRYFISKVFYAEALYSENYIVKISRPDWKNNFNNSIVEVVIDVNGDDVEESITRSLGFGLSRLTQSNRSNVFKSQFGMPFYKQIYYKIDQNPMPSFYGASFAKDRDEGLHQTGFSQSSVIELANLITQYPATLMSCEYNVAMPRDIFHLILRYLPLSQWAVLSRVSKSSNAYLGSVIKIINYILQYYVNLNITKMTDLTLYFDANHIKLSFKDQNRDLRTLRCPNWLICRVPSLKFYTNTATLTTDANLNSQFKYEFKESSCRRLTYLLSLSYFLKNAIDIFIVLHPELFAEAPASSVPTCLNVIKTTEYDHLLKFLVAHNIINYDSDRGIIALSTCLGKGMYEYVHSTEQQRISALNRCNIVLQDASLIFTGSYLDVFSALYDMGTHVNYLNIATKWGLWDLINGEIADHHIKELLETQYIQEVCLPLEVQNQFNSTDVPNVEDLSDSFREMCLDNATQYFHEKLSDTFDELYKILAYLIRYQFIKRNENDKCVISKMADFLKSDHPYSLKPTLLIWNHEWQVALERFDYLYYLDDDYSTPFKRANGITFYDHLENQSNFRSTFHMGLACLTKYTDEKLVDALELNQSYAIADCRSIVDIAGGVGNLLAQIYQRYGAKIELTLYEQASVLALLVDDDAKPFKRVAGDFFLRSPDNAIPNDQDLYIIKGTLHNFEDSSCVRILSHLRERMPIKSHFYLIERIIPQIATPHVNYYGDQMMTMLLGGVGRSKQDWLRLLMQSGFNWLNHSNVQEVEDHSIMVCKPQASEILLEIGFFTSSDLTRNGLLRRVSSYFINHTELQLDNFADNSTHVESKAILSSIESLDDYNHEYVTLLLNIVTTRFKNIAVLKPLRLDQLDQLQNIQSMFNEKNYLYIPLYDDSQTKNHGMNWRGVIIDRAGKQAIYLAPFGQHLSAGLQQCLTTIFNLSLVSEIELHNYHNNELCHRYSGALTITLAVEVFKRIATADMPNRSRAEIQNWLTNVYQFAEFSNEDALIRFELQHLRWVAKFMQHYHDNYYEVSHK